MMRLCLCGGQTYCTYCRACACFCNHCGLWLFIVPRGEPEAPAHNATESVSVDDNPCICLGED
jgi:hypothetical protein